MHRRLALESLEQRQLLAVDTFQYAEPKSAGFEESLPREFFDVGELTYFHFTDNRTLWRTD